MSQDNKHNVTEQLNVIDAFFSPEYRQAEADYKTLLEVAASILYRASLPKDSRDREGVSLLIRYQAKAAKAVLAAHTE